MRFRSGNPRKYALVHYPDLAVKYLWRALLLAGLLGGSAPDARAQNEENIAELRALVEETFDSINLGAGYASIVDFAVSRDISAATFYPDETEGVVDPTLQNIKLPFRVVFGEEGSGPRPFVQGHVAHQTLEAEFDLLPGEIIYSEWNTWGGSLSGGYEIPIGESLTIMPVLNLGYGRLENRADFSGPLAEELLEPALSNLVFDWDANAVVYGASLAFDYRATFRRFDIEILGSLTHHRVESTSASSEFAEFDGQVTALDLELNAVHPTSWTLGGAPLSVVSLFGATDIFGPHRDALGFDRFFEAGLGLEADISARNWKVRSLRFGVKAIFGPDVSGWGLIIGYGF